MILTKIFCEIDDFCKVFEKSWRLSLITCGEKIRYRSSKLCLSEIMTIIVYFHFSHYRTFKHYYLNFVKVNLKDDFPNLVSYSRFMELYPGALVPLVVFLNRYKLSNCTGISFIDSTRLKVCDNRRIHSHTVFSNIAQRGKSSMGWFFGFKLHLVVNEYGEIISYALTPGNVDDRNEKAMKKLTKNISGKLFGDRGYLSKKLYETLHEKGIELITKIRKNMQNKLMKMTDKILLRKRAIIETINDILKNICQIEHTRHRSPVNFVVNLIAGLIGYTFLPKKPSLFKDGGKLDKLYA